MRSEERWLSNNYSPEQLEQQKGGREGARRAHIPIRF